MGHIGPDRGRVLRAQPGQRSTIGSMILYQGISWRQWLTAELIRWTNMLLEAGHRTWGALGPHLKPVACPVRGLAQ